MENNKNTISTLSLFLMVSKYDRGRKHANLTQLQDVIVLDITAMFSFYGDLPDHEITIHTTYNILQSGNSNYWRVLSIIWNIRASCLEM